MYIVAIAWLYVTLMMAVAEATSPTGSILGAIITFAFYGALPLGILIYIWLQVIRRRQRYQQALTAAVQPPQPATHPNEAAPATHLSAPDTSSKPPA